MNTGGNRNVEEDIRPHQRADREQEKGRPLQGRENNNLTPGNGDRHTEKGKGPELLCQQLSWSEFPPRGYKGGKGSGGLKGYGLSSVRFICGTQDIHKELEERVSEFLGTDDTILYAACYDANAGIFEPLLDSDSAIIADQLNHASIISGVRLCKARRYIYSHNSMGTGEYSFDGKDLPGLEAILMSEEVQNCRSAWWPPTASSA